MAEMLIGLRKENKQANNYLSSFTDIIELPEIGIWNKAPHFSHWTVTIVVIAVRTLQPFTIIFAPSLIFISLPHLLHFMDFWICFFI